MQQEARQRWTASTNRTTTTGLNSSSTIVETVEPFPTSSFFLPINTMTNGRDRTSEFQTTVKSFASRRNGLDRPLLPAANNRRAMNPMEQRSIFMQQAKNIGNDLSQTFLKLEQLTLIAKQSSLFNDKSMEIQDLTLSIKQDIGHLNKQIADLQQYMQMSQNSKSKNSQTHSNSVVFVLQSKLATMSNDFKQVLENRTQNLKDQKSRRENFSKSNVSASLSTSPPVLNEGSSILFRDEQRARSNGGDSVIDMGSENPFHSATKQQLQMIDETDSYLASRSEAMQNIEQTIVELGDIFTQLATMVRHQEELVHRIDANVDEATTHIEGAHTELLKYLRSVSSNRWLIIKVFAVLIIFFLIFIVFLA